MKYIITLLGIILLVSGCKNDTSIDDLNADDLQHQLNEVETEMDFLEAQIADFQEEIASLRDNNANLESEVNSLNQELNASLEDKVIDVAPKNDYKNVVIGIDNGFVYESYGHHEYIAYQSLSVIGYGDTESFEHKLIDLTNDEPPTMAFEISGELYDFQLQLIEWNEDFNDYAIEEVFCSFEVIRDTDIIFSSILAEGLSNELLTWKDPDGKEFYYLVRDIGMGEAFPTVLVSQYAELNPWWKE